MTYNKEKVKVISSKVGYDFIAKDYKKYHKELNSWDNGIFVRYLPRSLKGLSIVDLGAGDGRLTKLFQDKGIVRYLACDISQQMLDRGNNWYDKLNMDLMSPFPLEDNTFDVGLAFFVLLHLSDLENFFRETYRILSPGGRLIVLHHKERRSKVFDNLIDEFKIQTFIHRYDVIEKIAYDNFFQVDYTDLIQGGNNIGRLYCFTK